MNFNLQNFEISQLSIPRSNDASDFGNPVSFYVASVKKQHSAKLATKYLVKCYDIMSEEDRRQIEREISIQKSAKIACPEGVLGIVSETVQETKDEITLQGKSKYLILLQYSQINLRGLIQTQLNQPGSPYFDKSYILQLFIPLIENLATLQDNGRIAHRRLTLDSLYVVQDNADDPAHAPKLLIGDFCDAKGFIGEFNSEIREINRNEISRFPYQDDEAKDLMRKSIIESSTNYFKIDVYSLGIIFCQLLTLQFYANSWVFKEKFSKVQRAIQDTYGSSFMEFADEMLAPRADRKDFAQLSEWAERKFSLSRPSFTIISHNETSHIDMALRSDLESLTDSNESLNDRAEWQQPSELSSSQSISREKQQPSSLSRNNSSQMLRELHLQDNLLTAWNESAQEDRVEEEEEEEQKTNIYPQENLNLNQTNQQHPTQTLFYFKEQVDEEEEEEESGIDDPHHLSKSSNDFTSNNNIHMDESINLSNAFIVEGDRLIERSTYSRLTLRKRKYKDSEVEEAVTAVESEVLFEETAGQGIFLAKETTISNAELQFEDLCRRVKELYSWIDPKQLKNKTLIAKSSECSVFECDKSDRTYCLIKVFNQIKNTKIVKMVESLSKLRQSAGRQQVDIAEAVNVVKGNVVGLSELTVLRFKRPYSLSEKQLPKDFTFKKRLAVVESVANTLSDLLKQSPSIVHANLKPGNILLDQRLKPYLVDFEFSEIVPMIQSVVVNRSKKCCYTSPEQFNERQVSTRSDVWSLGLIMYELLFSKHMTERQVQSLGLRSQVIKASLDVDITSYTPSNFLSSIKTLIARMTSFAFEDRPMMSEVAEEIRKISGVCNRAPPNYSPLGSRINDLKQYTPTMFRASAAVALSQKAAAAAVNQTKQYVTQPIQSGGGGGFQSKYRKQSTALDIICRKDGGDEDTPVKKVATLHKMPSKQFPHSMSMCVTTSHHNLKPPSTPLHHLQTPTSTAQGGRGGTGAGSRTPQTPSTGNVFSNAASNVISNPFLRK